MLPGGSNYPPGVTGTEDYFYPEEPVYRCWTCMEDHADPGDCPNCGTALVEFYEDPPEDDPDAFDRANER